MSEAMIFLKDFFIFYRYLSTQIQDTLIQSEQIITTFLIIYVFSLSKPTLKKSPVFNQEPD